MILEKKENFREEFTTTILNFNAIRQSPVINFPYLPLARKLGFPRYMLHPHTSSHQIEAIKSCALLCPLVAMRHLAPQTLKLEEACTKCSLLSHTSCKLMCPTKLLILHSLRISKKSVSIPLLMFFLTNKSFKFISQKNLIYSKP